MFNSNNDGLNQSVREANNFTCIDPRKPLPKICIDLLNENQLKKKLKSFSLPTNGNNNILRRRLKEYILSFNAECDSSNPRPAGDIAKEVIIREKEILSAKYTPKLVATHDHRVSLEEKLKINNKHSKDNNDHFQSLIEDAKRRSASFDPPIKKEKKSSVFRETYAFSIISPTKTKTNDEFVNAENQNISLVNNDVSVANGKEFVFDTPKKFKTAIVDKGNPRRKMLSGKKGTEKSVKKQRSKNMIENYFSKVEKTMSKENMDGKDQSHVFIPKKEESILVEESDSNSDEGSFRELPCNIPESPEIISSSHYSLKLASHQKQRGNISGISPILSNAACRKPRRKIFGSFSCPKIPEKEEEETTALGSGSDEITHDASFENHLDTLVKDAFAEIISVDSDATLSDDDVIPVPPSEYSFSFNEADFNS